MYWARRPAAHEPRRIYGVRKPRKPASHRKSGFTALCGGAGMWRMLAGVRLWHSGGGGPAPKAATRVAASTPPPSIYIYSKELPLGFQSHFRISSLCVCARAPFVL